MYLLASSGILKTYNRKKIYFNSADITSFKRKYITIRILEKTTGLNRKHILDVITRLRVPTANIRHGKSSVTIFKRNDINNIHFQASCEFASALYCTDCQSITFDQARINLQLEKYELLKLASELVHRRPFIYQSAHFRKVFSLNEYDEIKEQISESEPLEAIIRECGLSKDQILKQFSIIRNKNIFYLHRIAHIKRSLALDIKFYYWNYISIYKAAIYINASPRLLIKLLANHPDPSPYLKSMPSVKCVSAGHLDFLCNLIRGHAENFLGPIRLF